MKKLTTDEFIEKARMVHGDRYDYTLVKYSNCKNNIKIICDKHGEFEQIATNHLNGSNCPKCVGLYMDTNYFIEKANIVHKYKYDYSLVNYINQLIPVEIICKKHCIFKQLSNHHLQKSGCPKCVGFKKTTEEFINQSKIIHGDIYDYSLVNYINATNKIKILCFKHVMFEQKPNGHLNGKGCKYCRESKGEKHIEKMLNKKNIEFIRQKTFGLCKNKNILRFDFYLPNNNILIEYDGEQHFKSIEYWGGDKEFEIRQKNDSIKNLFAVNRGINLIRIKYNEINNIEKILNNIL